MMHKKYQHIVDSIIKIQGEDAKLPRQILEYDLYRLIEFECSKVRQAAYEEGYTEGKKSLGYYN